ncbi:MAG: hypothetical protein JKY94_17715 [Rhodobacteraceae bacterium]|nr:hypothetical protein [Paracoccaceae bacterium]
MKIHYVDWNPTAASKQTVETANAIIEEYEADGYTLTLRQLYYQFVQRGYIENTTRSYKNLGSLITKAREAGLLSWTAIEDNERVLKEWHIQENERMIIAGLETDLVLDKWAQQDTYVEVWVEKAALAEVVGRAASQFQVPYLACKGFLSASAAWRAGQRFEYAQAQGKDCVVLHLGDHDPSGLDMTRDNQDRLDIFAGEHAVEVRRLALNMSQVEQYTPPPNPAKMTDSRAAGYVQRYGGSSWELDALEPAVISDLITDDLREIIDEDVWEETKRAQVEARKTLVALSYNWDEISRYIEENFADD